LNKFLNSALDDIIKFQTFDFLYLIDFGLSYVSHVIEDKAVDLYVLKRAIISANPRSEEVFDKMMDIYVKTATKGDKIYEHLKKVELRGRKKINFG
jgi:TP53 regulating kinase-like protein